MFRRSISMATALLALAIPGVLHAQAWPAKPVRIVIGFPPGAGIDIALRLIAPEMAETLGQSVVVDNRPGAGGNIGAELAARAPADGYTLLGGGAPQAISQTLYSKLAYDLLKDFDAVALVASVPQLFVVHPSLPARSVKEFVALAKRSQEPLTYASTGSGSSPHLIAEMLKLHAGIRMEHIPYKGTPQATADDGPGHVHVGKRALGSAAREKRQAASRRDHEREAQRRYAERTRRRGNLSGLRGGHVVRTVGARRHAQGGGQSRARRSHARDAVARDPGQVPGAGCGAVVGHAAGRRSVHSVGGGEMGQGREGFGGPGGLKLLKAARCVTNLKAIRREESHRCSLLRQQLERFQQIPDFLALFLARADVRRPDGCVRERARRDEGFLDECSGRGRSVRA
jgi:Tripartite tricarboxylate transporter family receptor